MRLSFGREFMDEWTTPKVWKLDKPSPFEETRVLNPPPSQRVLKGIRRNLDTMFPQLVNTPIVESWAGTIESSPDVVPVIDAIDSLQGFHVATGFSGHGFGIGPGAGKAIAGDGEPYRYLVESIRKFPNQKDFAKMIERAGFSRVKFTNYSGGIAALHSGWKL
mgnify:CR=1 FL=1